MIDNELLKKIGEAHRDKTDEAIIYGEIKNGMQKVMLSGGLVPMMQMIENLMSRISKMTGISFNELEEMLWNIRKHNKEKEEQR